MGWGAQEESWPMPRLEIACTERRTDRDGATTSTRPSMRSMSNCFFSSLARK